MDKQAEFAIDIQISGTTINIEFEPLQDNLVEAEEAAKLLFKKLIRDFTSIDHRFDDIKNSN